MQDGKSRHVCEGGGGEIEIVPHPNDVGIREVGVKRRIRVSAVAVVGLPGEGVSTEYEASGKQEDQSGIHRKLVVMKIYWIGAI
jgi:hypothetical protein